MMKRRFRKKNHSSQPDGRSINPLKHSYESGGATSRMRGNAQQLHEKYTALAREALGNGDRIMMEHYFQYAEHYQRQINRYQENMENRNRDYFSPSGEDGGDSGQRRSSGPGGPGGPPRMAGERPQRPPRPSHSEDGAPPRHAAPRSRPPADDDGDDNALPIPGPINRRASAPAAEANGAEAEDAPPAAKKRGRPPKAAPAADAPAPDDDDDML